MRTAQRRRRPGALGISNNPLRQFCCSHGGIVMSKNEKSPAFTSPSLDAQPRAVTPRVISATAVVLLHAGLLVAFVSGVAPVQMLNVPSTPTLVFVPESPSAPLPQSRPPLPVTQPVMTLSRSESTFVADLPEIPLFQEEDSMGAGPVTNDEVRPPRNPVAWARCLRGLPC